MPFQFWFSGHSYSCVVFFSGTIFVKPIYLSSPKLVGPTGGILIHSKTTRPPFPTSKLMKNAVLDVSAEILECFDSDADSDSKLYCISLSNICFGSYRYCYIKCHNHTNSAASGLSKSNHTNSAAGGFNKST